MALQNFAVTATTMLQTRLWFLHNFWHSLLRFLRTHKLNFPRRFYKEMSIMHFANNIYASFDFFRKWIYCFWLTRSISVPRIISSTGHSARKSSKMQKKLLFACCSFQTPQLYMPHQNFGVSLFAIWNNYITKFIILYLPICIFHSTIYA